MADYAAFIREKFSLSPGTDQRELAHMDLTREALKYMKLRHAEWRRGPTDSVNGLVADGSAISEPGTSKSTRMTREYLATAHILLMDHATECTYLLKERAGKLRRKMIQSELGLLADVDPDAAIKAARIIRDRHMPTGEAIDYVRLYRLGDSQGDASVLTRQLVNVVNNFMQRYQQTATADALRALAITAESVRRHAQAPEPLNDGLHTTGRI